MRYNELAKDQKDDISRKLAFATPIASWDIRTILDNVNPIVQEFSLSEGEFYIKLHDFPKVLEGMAKILEIS